MPRNESRQGWCSIRVACAAQLKIEWRLICAGVLIYYPKLRVSGVDISVHGSYTTSIVRLNCFFGEPFTRESCIKWIAILLEGFIRLFP